MNEFAPVIISMLAQGPMVLGQNGDTHHNDTLPWKIMFVI